MSRLRKITVVRYGAASLGALALDMSSFLALLSLSVSAISASAAAYSIGIVAHWLFSSRKVFTESVATGGTARTRQKALFVLSALIGLSITTAIVGVAATSGFDPRLAKLIAVAASFTATWLLRDRLVFRPVVS